MSELDRILSERRRSQGGDVAAAIAEIEELDSFCQSLARAADDENDDGWEKVFDAVFSDAVSKRVGACSVVIGVGFDYYDPDTTYREDAMAFINALHEYAQAL